MKIEYQPYMTTMLNKYKSKVHGWSLQFTKILDLVPSFSKVQGWSLGFGRFK
ncbi:hypothetical protein Hanom_Chr04g00329531 [Helianthus anomalus]